MNSNKERLTYFQYKNRDKNKRGFLEIISRTNKDSSVF